LSIILAPHRQKKRTVRSKRGWKDSLRSAYLEALPQLIKTHRQPKKRLQEKAHTQNYQGSKEAVQL